jgi:hypothetical protein
MSEVSVPSRIYADLNGSVTDEQKNSQLTGGDITVICERHTNSVLAGKPRRSDEDRPPVSLLRRANL